MSSSCSNFCKHEFRKYHLSLDYVSPYDFITFQCGYHRVYVIWRIFWALYHFVWIILTGIYSYQWAGYDPEQQVKWFIYLTDWAYFILTFSTIFDAFCVVFIGMKKEDILQDICPIMPWYLKADWVLFNVSNTVSITVSIMYWGLIYSSKEPMTAVNIETHALNAVYVILNLLMTGIPIRFYHFFHPMIFGIIYIIFTVIYQVSGGTNHNNKKYVYSILDWSNTTYTAMIALLVVLVAIPICHFIMFLLHLLRIYLNKKCCSRNKRKCTIVTPSTKSMQNGSSLEMKNNRDDPEVAMEKVKTEKLSSELIDLSDISENVENEETEKETLKEKISDSNKQSEKSEKASINNGFTIEDENKGQNSKLQETKENICVAEETT